MSAFEMLLNDVESEERLRGRGFERLCKWVLENTPEYASRLKRVWMWDEWPGRWGKDAGIDLVAEDRDSGLWAIQAKHYNPSYAIKKSDLDSFLSESSRPEFTFRLLIASTDHLGPTARRTLHAQEKPVGTLLRSDLDGLDLVWPRNVADFRPTRANPKRLRPQQRRAVRDTIAGLEKVDRGQVLMACGTGKTLVARFLHDEMGSSRTLVLVPSLSLLKQSLREWLSAGGFDYLAVCSDDTVTPDETDAVVSSTSEIGLPVTTDPDQIGAFLKRRSGGVVFATYQSSPRIATAMSEGTPSFDLVVADEAHRCAGPHAGAFSTVLDPARINAHKRVFMTATPRYYTGRVKNAAREDEWEVASMDDELKFGPVLHRLSFATAIEQELLSDYQVVVVGVTDRDYREMADRGTFVTTDGETVTDARTLGRQIGLMRAIQSHGLRRIVTFHSRISNASRFAKSLEALAGWLPSELRPTGDLWAAHVSGRMTSGEREMRINQLRAVTGDERGVLTNARCLAEGVDVPTLDGVAFIDPRSSQIDIIQAVGRAIRKADDKTIGTIVIPVFVDENTDPEATLEASEFVRVWQAIKALRAHDDVLAEELDELRRELGRRKTLGARPGKIKLDLPTRVGEDFVRAFDARLVQELTTSWEFSYGVLQRFVDRAGTARVPKRHFEDDFPLGSWAASQRIRFERGDLSNDRVAQLEAQPGWAWDLNDDRWELGYSHLREFVEREHHANVVQSYKEADGYRLGQWVNVQRLFGRKGKLSADRTARLERLEGWSWDAPSDAWDTGLTQLKRFVESNNHARVPSNHLTEDGFKLGQWVVVQRSFRVQNRLSPERVARLESVPQWTWNAKDAEWEDSFAALALFVEREGHARVASTHVEGDHPLGRWVVKQRSRRDELSDERCRRLETLPGWVWTTRSKKKGRAADAA